MSLREAPASSRLWVGYHQSGISVKKTATGPFIVADRATVPAGLRLPADGPAPVDTAAIGRYLRRYHLRLPAGTEATCLLEDREGNAWLGTAGQGLWRHPDRHLRLEPYPASAAGQWPALTTTGSKAAAEAWADFGGNRFFQLQLNRPALVQDGDFVAPELAGKSVQAFLPRPAVLGGGFWLGTAAGLFVATRPGLIPQATPGLPGNSGFSITALAYAPVGGHGG